MIKACHHAAAVVILIALAVLPGNDVFAAEADEGKTLQIPWEKIEGTLRYDVIIRESSGREVFRGSVAAEYVEFTLPVGRYQIRVTPINKFGKAGAPSEWEEFEIAEMTPALKVMSKTVFRMSAGMSYSHASSPWNGELKDSLPGGMLHLGAYNTFGFMRYTGVEVETGVQRFRGKDAAESLTNVTFGGNIFFTTGLDFPLNLIARGGLGMAASRLLYKESVSGKTNLLWSGFPYFKAGASLLWDINRNVFLESGADYTITRLRSRQLETIDAFLRAGYRLRWKPGVVEVKEEEGKSIGRSFPLLLRISAGLPYMRIINGVEHVKKDSLAGAEASLGVSGRRGPFRYGGVEAQAAWAGFEGSGVTRGLSWTLVSGGVFFTTGFNYPLNALFRIGAGAAVSRLEYQDPFSFKNISLYSEKGFYRAGGALEYAFYKGLYAEVGCDYLAGVLTYAGRNIDMMHYYLRAGIKL